MKRAVAITIAGQKYTIKSDADDVYVHSLAGLVDGKIKELQKAYKSSSLQAVAVLAALQFADDFVREKRSGSELRKKVRDRSKALRHYLDRELGRGLGS